MSDVVRSTMDTVWPHMLVCPMCGFDYVRTGWVEMTSNGTNKANTVVRVEATGECGHRWFVCFTFHKGQTFLHQETP
jgi:hypothetical protein